jgi:hypothetical protein
MAGEQAIRELLDLDERETVVEIGVFPSPSSEIAEAEAAEGVAEERSAGMSGDMLALLGMTEHWSVAPRIAPVLPRGRALRYDIDPRIVLLEDIPEPITSRGGVVRDGPGRWLMDTRNDEPAVLVLSGDDGHDRLVLWGAGGKVRMFSWRGKRD